MSELVTASKLVPLSQGVSASDEAGLRRAIRVPVVRGLVLIVLFLGGFLAWGLLVPIAGGAVASGVISPDGNRRTVQHLEGGIIAALQVRDGASCAARAA